MSTYVSFYVEGIVECFGMLYASKCQKIKPTNTSKPTSIVAVRKHWLLSTGPPKTLPRPACMHVYATPGRETANQNKAHGL